MCLLIDKPVKINVLFLNKYDIHVTCNVNYIKLIYFYFIYHDHNVGFKTTPDSVMAIEIAETAV